jgi:hypothetical protein
MATAASSRLAIAAQIRRATREAHRQVKAMDAEAERDLARIYRGAAEEIADRIKWHGAGDETITIAELRQLREQIMQRLTGLARDRDALIDASLRQAVSLGTEPFGLEVGARMRVNESALRFVRSFVAKDGLQLSDRLWRLDAGARDRLVGAVERAVVLGKSAAEAAVDYLRAGQQPPADLAAKIAGARSGKVSQVAMDALVFSDDSPAANARRVLRTEINRAHGEAYMMAGADHPDTAGWRFLLSPAHPAPDICDLLSEQNLYGLGPGVYPSREKLPWPAHPNTLSFVEIVFADEISVKDREGKETSKDALARLTPDQQIGVLGLGKWKMYQEGELPPNAIRTPLRVVQKRVGRSAVEVVPPPAPRPSPPPRPTPPPAKPLGLDDYIAFGREKGAQLLARSKALRGEPAVALHKVLLEDLAKARPLGRAAKLQGGGAGVKLVEDASKLFPAAWVERADALGPLFARKTAGRGSQLTFTPEDAGKLYRVGPWGLVTARPGMGFIRADRLATAVHEYAHRLQAAMPDLDDIFQQHFERRTVGQALQQLRALDPMKSYAPREMARDDAFPNKYYGKVYSSAHQRRGRAGALETMTMSLEETLSGEPARLARLFVEDRETFHLTLGLLYRYAP